LRKKDRKAASFYAGYAGREYLSQKISIAGNKSLDTGEVFLERVSDAKN